MLYNNNILDELMLQTFTVQEGKLVNERFQLRVVDKKMQPILEPREPLQDCLMNNTVPTEICPCPFGYRAVRDSNFCQEEGEFNRKYSLTKLLIKLFV